MGLALLLSALILDDFNNLTDKQLSLIHSGIAVWIWVASTVLIIGLLAGFYPAIVMASIQPARALSSKSARQGSTRFRQLLIIWQFSVCIENLPDVMAHLETVWKTFHPDCASEFVFVDDAFDRKYEGEKKQRSLYAVSSGLAIAIACLGLLGLIAYTAEVRTKEIGIRKVLGATEGSIVSLLTKEFLVLVALASVLAWPVAYYTMGGWLENFAYRIDLSPTYFIASTGAALIITLITIAYQALKAARANPVEALRYE